MTNTKRLLLALALAGFVLPAYSQTTFPPSRTAAGILPTAVGTYNLCVETDVAAATTGTIKETLATCTIPADSLGAGDDFAGFEVQATFNTAANANSKTAGVDLGGTAFLTRTSSGNDTAITFTAVCLVSDSNKLLCTASEGYDATGVVTYTPATSASFTFSSTIAVTFFGTTATSAGDLTLTSYRVAFISAYGSDPDSFWPLLAPDGGITAPAYAFTTDSGAGMAYFAGGLLLQNQASTDVAGRSWVQVRDESITMSQFYEATSTATGAFGMNDEGTSEPRAYLQMKDISGDSAALYLSTLGAAPEASLRLDVAGAGAVSVMTVVPTGIQLTPILFAALGTPADGTLTYCSDCTKATPCTGSGTGALAKRFNGAWDCD